MRNRWLLWILSLFLASAFTCGAFISHAENDVPISLLITLPSDIKLESAGIVDSLVFTISNESENPYTLYHAKLSGGFDNEVRTLNDEITVDSYSTREFTLTDVSVSDEQLDRDIVYLLSWDELVVSEHSNTDPADSVSEDLSSDSDIETDSTIEETDLSLSNYDYDNNSEDGLSLDTGEENYEFIHKSIEASVRIDRFIPPVLGVSVKSSTSSASDGDTFSITYIISNDTEYDVSGIMLTDADVYDGAIPIPTTELAIGDSTSITIDYVMGIEDMEFCPAVSYVASQRQFESRLEEPVIIDSVITGIMIDVEQYPSNEEGSTFAITVTNTGNRMLTGLQLYDEINTAIDFPFDLSPQQQKVVTFNVPSAYSAGLIRNVRFRITGYDYYGDPFSYTDVNSYECVPYITSDEVRLSVLASLKNAFFDENGKLCGEILLEIRNYSDVRLTSAVLSELTLFGTLETYRELLRGETYYTSVFQLDGVDQLQFCVTASDSTGQTYNSEIVLLDLDHLASLASKPEGQRIVYHSNTFLSELTAKIAETFRNAFLATFVLVMLSTTICLVLWFLEERLKSRLPSDSLINIVVPESKTPKTAMDQVLNSSPAELLGYTVPTKIRYGATTIKTSANNPRRSRRFVGDQLLNNRDADIKYHFHRNNHQADGIEENNDSVLSDRRKHNSGLGIERVETSSNEKSDFEIVEPSSVGSIEDSAFREYSFREISDKSQQANPVNIENSFVNQTDKSINDNLDLPNTIAYDTCNAEGVNPNSGEKEIEYTEISEAFDSLIPRNDSSDCNEETTHAEMIEDTNTIGIKDQDNDEDTSSESVFFDGDIIEKDNTERPYLADHTVRVIDFYSVKKKNRYAPNSVVRMKNWRK